MIRYILTIALVVAIQLPAYAGGGLFRRNICRSSHCAPVHHQVAFPINQGYVAPQAGPIIVQNNFPPAANLGSTTYGYEPQSLGYNPFQVDPSEIVREAARLTAASQDLTREGLAAYNELGADALEYAALSDQLRARAELIRATEPEALRQAATARVESVKMNQTIKLIPDGAGGYKVEVEAIQHSTDSGSPEPSADASAGLNVLQTKCASCHTGSGSKGGFALFGDDGQPVALTAFQKKKVISLTNSGAMPPSENAAGQELPPLSDVEFAALRLYLGE